MSLSLEIVEGPDVGRRVQLLGPIEIGRGQDAAFVLADGQVSRRHARLTPEETGALVEDLRSSNGTFVNGAEIHSPVRIEPGDRLQLGVTVLELRSSAQIAERPSAVVPVPPALALPSRPAEYLPPHLLHGAVAGGHDHELDPLLDARTKGKARTAPLTIFVLVVLVVLIYLATR